MPKHVSILSWVGRDSCWSDLLVSFGFPLDRQHFTATKRDHMLEIFNFKGPNWCGRVRFPSKYQACISSEVLSIEKGFEQEKTSNGSDHSVHGANLLASSGYSVFRDLSLSVRTPEPK